MVFLGLSMEKYELKAKEKPRADYAVTGVHVGYGREFQWAVPNSTLAV